MLFIVLVGFIKLCLTLLCKSHISVFLCQHDHINVLKGFSYVSVTMLCESLYFLFKTKARISTFLNDNIVVPFNNIVTSVYADRIVRVDEYDISYMGRRNVFNTFFMFDLFRYVFLGIPCGLTSFEVPENVSGTKIYNIRFWNGSNTLVRRGSERVKGGHTSVQAKHFHDNAFLYAAIHKGKVGKIEVTDFMNTYSGCLCFTVNELVRLLFSMNILGIEDYHCILQSGATAITMITCSDDLCVTTLQNDEQCACACVST